MTNYHLRIASSLWRRVIFCITKPQAVRQAGLSFPTRSLRHGIIAATNRYGLLKAIFHNRITETKPQKDPHYDNLARLLSKISYQVRDGPHSVSETLEYRHAGDLPVRCAGFSYQHPGPGSRS